jgi:arylsulfatase A-like enzyme
VQRPPRGSSGPASTKKSPESGILSEQTTPPVTPRSPRDSTPDPGILLKPTALILAFGALMACSCQGEPDIAASADRTESPPPNVLLYVIDGGGADLMSLYGYERPTTPHIEALAQEGVVFESARVPSAWTKSSTASFMTSLHHSVLGGFTKNEDRIPDGVVTMAQHFDAAGYQTAVLTSNPFAASMSGLEAGVGRFRDKAAAHNSASSVELHADFLQWDTDRAPGPWWAHIQTTDVHEPHQPVSPFAGRYASPERRAEFETWWAAFHALEGVERDTVLGRYKAQLVQMEVDPRDFFRTQWDLHDETMTHNDATLGAFVAELKARGEWDNTLFILTADHGHPAGSFSRFGRGLIEPQPADWEGALADSYRTRVPLVVVWPGHLPAGVRIDAPVSLIDLLPTVLALAGLPPAEIQQGQSLVPLLTATGDWASSPVVLEQVQAYEPTGEMVGHIELIDGRWAASLEVMPASLASVYQATTSLKTAGGWRAARPHRPTTPPLLLYDLAADPFCTQNVNDEHPERVAEYTERLQALWVEHQDLAAGFQPSEAAVAGDAQIEALRTLGYVD